MTVASIWKQNPHTHDLYDGPSSKLEVVGFHFAAEWSEADGVQFWGTLERDSEEYTLAEVRKIHATIGRLLAKVDAEPTPTRP